MEERGEGQQSCRSPAGLWFQSPRPARQQRCRQFCRLSADSNIREAGSCERLSQPSQLLLGTLATLTVEFMNTR